MQKVRGRSPQVWQGVWGHGKTGWVWGGGRPPNSNIFLLLCLFYFENLYFIVGGQIVYLDGFGFILAK